MTELVDRPEVLRQRIGSVQKFLAAGAGINPEAIQWRVAASTVHLGLIARLLAPALASAVLTDRTPDLRLTEFFWQPTLGGPYPLSVAESPLSPLELDVGVDSHQVADDLSRWITTGPIEQLTRTMSAAGGVSEKVLRGNIASALHSAAQQIVPAQPDLADRTTALLDTVADHQSLRGTGRVLPSGSFRRNSCCLIYRAMPPMPEAGGRMVCGDCVLTAD